MTVVEQRSRGLVPCPACGGAVERAAGTIVECRRCRRRVDLLELADSDGGAT